MSDPGAGGFPSTALAAVSAASLSALRSVNRTMSAAAAAGGGGGGVQRHVVGLGRCVVRGCVHLLQVVRVRRWVAYCGCGCIGLGVGCRCRCSFSHVIVAASAVE